MADVNFQSVDRSFDIAMPLVHYGTTSLANGSLFSWLSAGAPGAGPNGIAVAGTGFTYFGGLPNGGQINSVAIDLDADNALMPEITVSGLSIDFFRLGPIVAGVLSDQQENNLSWSLFLGGEDQFRLPTTTTGSFSINVAGDGRNVEAGTTVTGRTDTFDGFLSGTAATDAGRAIGDFWEVETGAVLAGGDDSITASGPFGQIIGDAMWVRGLVFGGHDQLYERPGSNLALVAGDASTVWGELEGGNDLIVVRGDTNAYGDARSILVGARFEGGDDEIFGGDGGSFLVGDAQTVSTGGTPPNAVGGHDFIYGNAGDDWIYGDFRTSAVAGILGGDDWLVGGAGNDMIYGGGGNDWISYEDATTAGVVVRFTGLDSGGTIGGLEIGIDEFWEIENVHGSPLGDFLEGSDLANTIDGDLGDDWIDGGGGADVLRGGGGNDRYRVDDAGDAVFEYLDEGYDRVFVSGLSSYTLPTEVERLTFEDTGNHIGKGNSLDNRLEGNAGNDRFLIDVGGADIFSGGAGLDVFDARTSAIEVRIYLNDQSLNSYATAGDFFASIETFIGSATADDVMRTGAGRARFSGSGGDDRLWGGNNIDYLRGDAGNDDLRGGAARDTLIGGTGNDDLYGGNDRDQFRFVEADFGQDTIYDWQDGLDYLRFFSAVANDISDFTITGNGTSIVRMSLNADPTNFIDILGNGGSAVTIDAGDVQFY